MKLVKFREHRGGLAESMRTLMEVIDRKQLQRLLVEKSAPWEVQLRELIALHGLEVKPYTYDERINWDTHIVTLEGYGVIGFTDGPLD